MLVGLLPLDAVTGAHPTGYDRHGWLCKQLSLPEIREFRAQMRKHHRTARSRAFSGTPQQRVVIHGLGGSSRGQ